MLEEASVEIRAGMQQKMSFEECVTLLWVAAVSTANSEPCGSSSEFPAAQQV